MSKGINQNCKTLIGEINKYYVPPNVLTGNNILNFDNGEEVGVIDILGITMLYIKNILFVKNIYNGINIFFIIYDDWQFFDTNVSNEWYND